LCVAYIQIAFMVASLISKTVNLNTTVRVTDSGKYIRVCIAA